MADKLIEKIEAVMVPGYYGIKYNEFCDIRDAAEGDAGLMVGRAFVYGFMRGQAAEKNRRRKNDKSKV